MFIQFGWSAPNSHNVEVLEKAESYQIIWDSVYSVIPGSELTTNFIE